MNRRFPPHSGDDAYFRWLTAGLQKLVDECGLWNSEIRIPRRAGTNANVILDIRENLLSARDQLPRRAGRPQLELTATHALCCQVLADLLATGDVRFGAYHVKVAAGRLCDLRIANSWRPDKDL
jgi:hypothetical protein